MTNVLKTIIVDDEALARRGLKSRLAKRDEVQVIAEAKNGREALSLIREHGPDLVFLDVQMPGMDGFDVLRSLQPDEMPRVVFVTAFDDFAIKAFDSNAVDYLLKPIEDDRLDHALERVKKSFNPRGALKHRRALLKLVGDLTGDSVGSVRELNSKNLKKKSVPKLAIKDGGQTIWVPQDKIEWIDAAGDYMCVHSGGETHIMRMTMKKLEQYLDADFLQRIHRSTIVNIHQVKEMQAHINGEYFLTLKGGHTVKMSRTYKNKLRLLKQAPHLSRWRP